MAKYSLSEFEQVLMMQVENMDEQINVLESENETHKLLAKEYERDKLRLFEECQAKDQAITTLNLKIKELVEKVKALNKKVEGLESLNEEYAYGKMAKAQDVTAK